MRTYNRVLSPHKTSVSQIKTLCRLCMNSDITMYDIFDVPEGHSSKSVATKIENCLSIKVKDCDNMPNKLCSSCFDSLNSFNEFWERCQQTDKKLLELVETSESTPCLFDATFPLTSPSSCADECPSPPQPPTEHAGFSDNKKYYRANIFSHHEDNLCLLNSNIAENVTSSSTCQKLSQVPVELPEIIPHCSISNVGNQSSDPPDDDLSLKLEFEEVNDIDEKSEAVEVQVSMSGNSYLIEVLDQSEKEELNVGMNNTGNNKVDETHIFNLENIAKLQCLDKQPHMLPHSSDSSENQLELKTLRKNQYDGHVCQTCLKSFPIRGALMRHERVHSGEKPYTCIQCSRSFSQKVILRRHMLTHTGVKPYKCESCEKSYTQKEALKAHIRSRHIPQNLLEINQYQCSLCDKCFCHLSGLSRHQQSHKGKKYPCKLCNRVYTDRSCLKRHNLKVHCSENSKKNENNVGENCIKNLTVISEPG